MIYNNKRRIQPRRLSVFTSIGSPLLYSLRRLFTLSLLFVFSQLNANNVSSIDQKVSMLKDFLGDYEFVSVVKEVKKNGVTDEITLTGTDLSIAEEICGSNFYVKTTDRQKFLVLGVLTTFELTGEPTKVNITTAALKGGRELEINGTILAEDTEIGKPIGDETRDFIYKFVRKDNGHTEGYAEIKITTPNPQKTGEFFSDTYICKLKKVAN